MKLLLTSAGVTNDSIRDALVALLGKPIAEANALCVPTAQYGHPACGPLSARRFVAGESPLPMVDLGWASIGVLELTALSSIGAERWEPWVREADVLLVAGGDSAYLAHWIAESGLAGLLPSLDDTVWVGLSAGSMALTPRVGDTFVEWRPPGGTDRTLGLVDFSIFPHLEEVPDNSMGHAERWAAELAAPAYAVDDQTAISVVDGRVEVISEGTWRFFGGPFVPDGFDPPTSLVADDFVLEPLGPQHNESDHAAWTSSIEHVRSTPGYPDGSWPPPEGMSLEANHGDLTRHAADFAARTGFTFTVLDPDRRDVIGCVYLYPSHTANADVVVQSWVRADRAHLDVPLADAVASWLTTDWPWTRPDRCGR